MAKKRGNKGAQHPKFKAKQMPKGGAKKPMPTFLQKKLGRKR